MDGEDGTSGSGGALWQASRWIDKGAVFTIALVVRNVSLTYWCDADECSGREARRLGLWSVAFRMVGKIPKLICSS